MRTFHIGGIASAGREDPVIHVRKAGKLKFVGLRRHIGKWAAGYPEQNWFNPSAGPR